MRRVTNLILILLLLCTLGSPAMAAEMSNGNEVVVKKTTTHEGDYRAEVENGQATAGGVSISGAPANAVTLVVVPMSGDALIWIDGCMEDKVIAAYDIHFLDAQGGRSNANGARVSITVSGTELSVSSVTTAGTDQALSSEIANGKVSFTTDGSHYYAIAKKDSGEQPGPGDTVTVPVTGDENTVHVDVTITEEDTVKLHELDFDEIDQIIGGNDADGLIEIDLTGLDDDICKIVLPVTSIEHIISEAQETHNEQEALQVDFPQGSVKLDDKTMRAITDQAECNEVILVLESVGESRLNHTQDAALADKNVVAGFEAYLLCVSANKRISDFEGGVATLSVPFTIPAGHSESGYTVWHIADNGTMEKLNSWFAGGRLHWDVGHFSDFIVTYESEPTHEHSYTKVVTDPTCTEKGYTTYTCECGDSYVADYTDPTGHSFTKYVSDNNATCKKDGTETAKCDHGCGETDTRTDKGSKLGHKYEDGKCIRCGASQWIPETGDTSNIFLWAGIMVMSVIVLILLLFWMRRKKNEVDNSK